MTDQALVRLRTMLLALPGVTERLSHHAPAFYISERRALCRFHDSDHDDRGRVAPTKLATEFDRSLGRC